MSEVCAFLRLLHHWYCTFVRGMCGTWSAACLRVEIAVLELNFRRCLCQASSLSVKLPFFVAGKLQHHEVTVTRVADIDEDSRVLSTLQTLKAPFGSHRACSPWQEVGFEKVIELIEDMVGIDGSHEG